MTEYIIPFKQGDIIAELGGGERPIFHPNIDVRQLSTVDIVTDFNKSLPIPDNSYNGIFCKYLLEHLSWRKTKSFLKDIFRVIKPGGTAIFITANLLEQAKVLVNTPDWNENLINMIFGGQRFDESKDFDEQWDQNSHHNGFSPEYITRLLKDIGFQEIKIIPIQTEVGPTDMIIETKKPDISNISNNQSHQSHPFNRLYFEGGTYTGEGYRDFPVHYNTLKMILDRKPESVIDIGGARGYIVKKLNDLNISSTCIDISEHCYHTRATDNFVLHDLTKIPYPFKDKQFDLAVSISVLEHISEDKIPQILKEIARISKRSFHGITFQTNPNDTDKTHINIKPIEWWKKAFEETLSTYQDYKYEILDKEDTEKGIPILPTNQDNLIKLNIGSFINMFHHSWQNIDIIDLTDFAKQNGYIFKQIDVSKELPYNNNSVDLIISSHFLEHLDRDKGKKFLSECLRVLKPSGTLRLSVPDTELLVKKYLDNTIDQYKHVNIGVEKSIDSALSLFELLLSGHNTSYDYDSLSKLLSKTSFTNIKRMEFNKSNSKDIETQTIDIYPTISLYVEATKPETKGPIITTGPITTKPTIAKEKLRIALISTPFFGVPPSRYGGLEQIVWDLAEALDELGHEVTIFAPEGSQKTKNGFLVETGKPIDIVNVDWFEEEKNRYEIYKDIIDDKKFDVIHDHTWFGFPYLLKQKYPNLKILHTHHSGFNWESPPPVKYPNLVALSRHMKNYTENYFKSLGYNISSQYIYNGINLDKYRYDPSMKKSDRLLYVGRFSKFKQPEVAIQVAKSAGLPIDLIGGTFIDNPNYLKDIESMCDKNNIVIYKDSSHDFKIKKMQEARALIFPSNMNEPFGLCLTPDSPILTLNKGVQKIKDIKVGEKVLTHRGRFRTVFQTLNREYNGDMLKIIPHKLKMPIILTPEHRVLAIKTVLCTNKSGNIVQDRGKDVICSPSSCYYMKDGRQYKWCRYVKGEEPYTRYKTEWIEAKYLEVGDFVVYPRINEKEKDIEKIRLIDYIDDFLNVSGDSYNDIGRQTDMFGEFVDKTLSMRNKGGTSNGTSFEKSRLPTEILLTPDLMRLFGYYIAEGCTKNDRQIEFSFNINEIGYVNDVTKLMKDIFGLDTEHIVEYQGIQTHNLRYSNKILSNVFQNMFAPKEYITKKGKGKKSNIVRIPPEFLNLPLNKLAELIKGEWRGDGSDSATSGYSIKTTSETLCHQLIYILSRFGILPSIQIKDPRKSEANKKWYKNIEKVSIQYIIEIHGKDVQIFYNMIGDKCTNIENIGKTNSRYLKGKNLFFTPIKEIEIMNYNGYVHNLEVEEDNSYVSPIVVHNCAVEAMSCGTPVISTNDGAINEIVIHGKTGFICKSTEEMIQSISKLSLINSEECRKRAEEFDRTIMAKNYIKLYQRILDNNEW